MATPASENQVPAIQSSDKEMNFRKLEQRLEQERQARELAEQRAAAAEKAAQERERTSKLNDEPSDEDDEPYVDRKRLEKRLNRFGEQTKAQTQAEIQQAVQAALDQERRSSYLKENNDFQQVMSSDLVQKFADKHPRLAENILRMPEGFERQKLVYENIKALGIDRPDQKAPSIQEKVDANRKSPFYQPSGSGSAPYSSQGDFSQAGIKNAYEKMQELKSRLRI